MQTEDPRHEDDLQEREVCRCPGTVLWQMSGDPLRRQRQRGSDESQLELPALPEHLQLLHLQEQEGEGSHRDPDQPRPEQGVLQRSRLSQRSHQEKREGGGGELVARSTLRFLLAILKTLEKERTDYSHYLPIFVSTIA